MIQRFEGHHGEVWALAVSNRGDFVVTGSHDKSLRVWEKTEEPLFLEEEREREIERMFDTNMANDLNRTEGEGADEDGLEAEAVQKTTTETMMAGERILEALEVAEADREMMAQYEDEKKKMGEMGAALPKPTRNPELVAKGDISAVEHVMGVLRKVPAASMEDALLVLPFRQVVSLLEYLDEWASAVNHPSPVLPSCKLSLTSRTETLSLYPGSCTFCSAHTPRKSLRPGPSAHSSLHCANTYAKHWTRNARPWDTIWQL
jgi:U3 small nucleolar RNA-associated protein 12